MKQLIDLLKDKKSLLKFLTATLSKSDKNKTGLRNSKLSEDITYTGKEMEKRINILLEVCANQETIIERLSAIAFIYTQSNSFDTDIAMMLNKMGKGSEAVKIMFDKKLNNQ